MHMAGCAHTSCAHGCVCAIRVSACRVDAGGSFLANTLHPERTFRRHCAAQQNCTRRPCSTMEITLTSNELYQVNSIRGRDTLVLLPKGKHKQHRIVVGDSGGTVTCIGVKRGSSRSEWKYGDKREGSSPSPQTAPINYVTVGGSKQDKIFLSRLTNVEGVNRKGKQFFEMNTNMTDNVNVVAVQDTKIFASANYTYNVFDNEKEIAHLMMPAPINSMCLAPLTDRSSGLRTLLGCADRVIRVVHEDKVLETVPLDGATQCLSLYHIRDRDAEKDTRARGSPTLDVVYGTDNGSLGMLMMPRNMAIAGGDVAADPENSEKEVVDEGKKEAAVLDLDFSPPTDDPEGQKSAIRRGWSIDAGMGKRKAAVNSMTSFDITADGTPDIIVGRNDGTLEVFGFDMGEECPKNQFETNIGESIRAIECGEVSNAGFNEIIAASFSGRIVGFTTESLTDKEASDKYGRSKGQVRREVQLSEMKSDIESLKKQVGTETKNLMKIMEKDGKAASRFEGDGAGKEKKKERKSIFKSLTGGGSKSKEKEAGSAVDGADDASIPGSYLFTPAFDVNHEFVLMPDQAVYALTVELPIPLDSILLAATVNIGVISDPDSKCIISQTKGPDDSQMLASVRVPQDDGTQHRAFVKVRAVEGQQGSLSAYIVGRTGTADSDRSAVCIKLPIKPLSLHTRIHEIPPVKSGQAERPMSTLTVTGTFSMGQAHQWILTALPDVPDIIQGESAHLIFQSTFVGTILTVSYEGGRVEVQSDSVSPLAIMKETITKDANSRSVRISVSSQIAENVAGHVLALINEKMQYQFGLKSRFQLVEALEEISSGQTSAQNSFLDPKLQTILTRKKEIANEVASSPQELEALFGVITDLFVDKHMFNGRRLQHMLPDLMVLLQNYDMESVVRFIDTGGEVGLRDERRY